MKNATKGKILKATALTIDVSVPLIAALTQFPVWIDRSSEATMSGVFLLLALLSCVPFLRQIKEFMKSPSAPIIWTVLFVLFIVLRNIIDQMVIVCFFGMIANFLGSGLYKLGGYIGEKPDTTEVE